MKENVIADTEQRKKEDISTDKVVQPFYLLVSRIILTSGILFLTLCFLASCSNQRTEWYEVTGCEDLRMIRLIKPYQLFTSIPEDSTWFLSFVNNGELSECGIDYDHQMPVTWINVKRDIIYGYSDEYQTAYFVVIPSKKIEKKFSNKNEWLLYLKEINQSIDTFYRPDKVDEILKSGPENYKALPWYNQIKDLIHSDIQSDIKK